MIIPAKTKLNFFNKFIKLENGCWEWQTDLNPNGYGRIYVGTQNGVKYCKALAHRVSWIIYGNSLKDSDNLLHKCDNPRCVNPEHLYIGTQKDNVRDMYDRNRVKLGIDNANAFLTFDKIQEMRKLYATGQYSQSDLAKMFKISQPYVGDLVNNLARLTV